MYNTITHHRTKKKRDKCEYSPTPTEVFIISNKILRPLGRPRRRWEDNIKMDLHKLGCEVMDWIELAQDSARWRALVNAVMNLWVP